MFFLADLSTPMISSPIQEMLLIPRSVSPVDTSLELHKDVQIPAGCLHLVLQLPSYLPVISDPYFLVLTPLFNTLLLSVGWT